MSRVVTTYISEYIFPDILRGIEQVLAQSGYTPFISATYNRVDNERDILNMLLTKPIDGIIIEGRKRRFRTRISTCITVSKKPISDGFH
jgi:GntR family transcriptional regulator of arabinose operon